MLDVRVFLSVVCLYVCCSLCACLYALVGLSWSCLLLALSAILFLPASKCASQRGRRTPNMTAPISNKQTSVRAFSPVGTVHHPASSKAHPQPPQMFGASLATLLGDRGRLPRPKQGPLRASRARQAPTGEKVSVLGKSRTGVSKPGVRHGNSGVREAGSSHQFHHHWVPP